MSCLENSVGNIIWNIVEIGVGKDTSVEILMAHVHMNIFSKYWRKGLVQEKDISFQSGRTASHALISGEVGGWNERSDKWSDGK